MHDADSVAQLSLQVFAAAVSDVLPPPAQQKYDASRPAGHVRSPQCATGTETLQRDTPFVEANDIDGAITTSFCGCRCCRRSNARRTQGCFRHRTDTSEGNLCFPPPVQCYSEAPRPAEHALSPNRGMGLFKRTQLVRRPRRRPLGSAASRSSSLCGCCGRTQSATSHAI